MSHSCIQVATPGGENFSKYASEGTVGHCSRPLVHFLLFGDHIKRAIFHRIVFLLVPFSLPTTPRAFLQFYWKTVRETGCICNRSCCKLRLSIKNKLPRAEEEQKESGRERVETNEVHFGYFY